MRVWRTSALPRDEAIPLAWGMYPLGNRAPEIGQARQGRPAREKSLEDSHVRGLRVLGRLYAPGAAAD